MYQRGAGGRKSDRSTGFRGAGRGDRLARVAVVLDRESLLREIDRERRAKRRIVFTNGCFDLLHAGHVRALRQAKALGDVLVVGVNDDASVRRLGKGDERPLVEDRQRAEVVAALAAVDYVTIFSGDTPLDLIRAVSPDVLVKGGDWLEKDIVGADVVRARGGRVVAVEHHPGLSTTEIVRKIRDASRR